MTVLSSIKKYIHGISLVCITLLVAHSAPLYAQTNGRRITNIIITGNKTTPSNAILHATPYHVGETFDRNKTRSAIHNIYGLKKFSNVKLYGKNKKDNTIVLHIVVTEKTPLKEVIITGNKAVSNREIFKKIGFDDIQTIDNATLQQYARQIQNMYLEKGYHKTRIDTQLTEDEQDGAVAHFVVHEGNKAVVKQVHFKGNNNISSKELRGVTITQEDWLLGFLNGAGSYHPEKLDADKHMIEQHYQNQGYMNARVINVDKQVDPKNEHMVLTFTIEEGDQYRIGTVSAPGNDLLPEQFLLAHIPLWPGSIYSRDALSNAIRQLEAVWGDHGYIFAHINPSIQPNKDTKTVDVVFYSDLGERVRLRKITIKGNRKTRDKVIRRKLPLQEGQFITKRLMEQAKRNVASLGYFDQKDGVNWKVIRRTNDMADLDLIVREAKTGHFGAQMSFGGQGIQSPSSGITFSIDYAETNLLGNATRVNANASWSQNDKNASFHVAQPWLFDKPITLGFDLYHRRPSYSQLHLLTKRAVHEKLTGGALSLGYITPPYLRVLHNTQISGNIGIDSVRYEERATARPDIDPQGVYQRILNQEFAQGDFVWLSFIAEQDLRNHPMHTSRGHRIRLSSRFALPTFNDDIGYAAINLDAHWFTPLIDERNLVFHLHGYIGYAQPFNNRAIPFGQLYHIGGESSVRGFNYGDIGPKYLNDTIGGSKAFFINAELVFPINPDMSMKGVVFYDGGSGWDNPYVRACESPGVTGNNFDYRHSVGFGIRVLNPMPIRIDWGFKIDPREGESSHQVHFSTSYDW